MVYLFKPFLLLFLVEAPDGYDHVQQSRVQHLKLAGRGLLHGHHLHAWPPLLVFQQNFRVYLVSAEGGEPHPHIIPGQRQIPHNLIHLLILPQHQIGLLQQDFAFVRHPQRILVPDK